MFEKIREIRGRTLENLREIVQENIDLLQDHGFHIIEVNSLKDIEKISEELFDGPVVKAKSNTFEEVSLGEFLKKKGMEIFETDCGEFIVNFLNADRRNPIRPSAHLSEKYLITEFSKRLNREIRDTKELKEIIKQMVIENIKKAEIALFGANAIAEGSIFLLENEGNMMRIFEKKRTVFVAGWEKFCKTLEEALFMCRAQAYYGVNYDRPAFIHIISGPSCTGDIGGKKIFGMYSFEEAYFILIDREKIYNSKYREILKCINCGRCSLVCPILEVTNFGNPGPKSLYFRFFWKQEDTFPEIFKCTLCGRCKEECPVGIDHIKVIRSLREEMIKNNMLPEKSKTVIENIRKFGNPVGEVKKGETVEIFCC